MQLLLSAGKRSSGVLLGALLMSQAFAQPIQLTPVGDWPGYRRGSTLGLAIRDGHAYIAARTGLEIHDVHDPANPGLVGRVTTTGSAWRVALAGNYACVVGIRRDPVAQRFVGRMEVIDVSDPSRPQRAGEIEFNGYGASSIAISGNLVYLATGAGLLVIDISTPTQPQQLGALAPGSYFYAVALSGGHAYLTGNQGLEVIDISTPSNPRSVGKWVTERSGYALAVAGHHAYLADGDGLTVLDVSNPAAPAWVGAYTTTQVVQGVAVQANTAYVAGLSAGLTVIDISNPAHPQRLGEAGNRTSGSQNHVLLSGNFAYVTDEIHGLQVIDVSDSSNPRQVGGYNIFGSATDVAFHGDHAFVADAWTGLKVIDVSTPSVPQLTGQCAMSAANETVASAVTVAGRFAYVGGFVDSTLPNESYNALWVVDVSDPTEPRVVAERTTDGSARRIAVSGDYIFVLGFRRDSVAELYVTVLEIFSISDPANPRWIAAYEFPPRPLNTGTAVFALSGRYAYVATGDGLQVLDVSEPTIPRWVGGYEVDVGIALAVSGNYAILGRNYRRDGTQTLGGGFLVLDISDPTQPRLVYEDSSGPIFYGFAFSGDYVLATHITLDEVLDQNNLNLEVIDLSNPASPQWVDTYTTRAYSIRGVAVFGQHVYLPKEGWGLEILRLVPTVDPVGLSARITGDTLTLSWPATATGFALESSAEPTATIWDPVPGTPELKGDDYELTVPTESPVRFFRLRKP